MGHDSEADPANGESSDDNRSQDGDQRIPTSSWTNREGGWTWLIPTSLRLKFRGPPEDLE